MKITSRYSLLFVSIALIVWTFAVDGEMILDRVEVFAADKPTVITILFAIFVAMPLLLISSLGFMIGTGILAIQMFRWSNHFCTGRRTPLLPFTFPVVAIVFLSVQAFPFLHVQAGTSIRPMGWAMHVMLIMVVLLIISIVRSVRLWRRNGHGIASAASIVMAFIMFVMPGVSMHLVSSIKGFHISP